MRGASCRDVMPMFRLAAGVLRARRPVCFEALGTVFLPADDSRRLPRDIECAGEPTESPPKGDDIPGRPSRLESPRKP
jgi:hypothetical protein